MGAGLALTLWRFDDDVAACARTLRSHGRSPRRRARTAP